MDPNRRARWIVSKLLQAFWRDLKDEGLLLPDIRMPESTLQGYAHMVRDMIDEPLPEPDSEEMKNRVIN